VRAALLLLVGACWTGPEPAPPPTIPPVKLLPRRASAFELTLERTPCFGMCPAYRLTISGDGTMVWHGLANVTALGERHTRVAASRVVELSRALDRVRFFELDDSGHLPNKPTCVRTGNSVSCSLSSVTICSDTSHAVISARRGAQHATVDDAHCSDTLPGLRVLEGMIDELAPDGWIGR
jgi:hypothetical protein